MAAYRTQKDAKSLFDSWDISNETAKREQYNKHDYAAEAELLKLLYPVQPENEEYYYQLAELLLERMRKQRVNGENIYDGYNKELLDLIRSAGFDIEGGDEFDMTPFYRPYDSEMKLFEDEKYLTHDLAQRLVELMDAADASSDSPQEMRYIYDEAASTLLDRMRKQQRLGENIYDAFNKQILDRLESAGYTFDPGSEFYMEPFDRPFNSQTGEFEGEIEMPFVWKGGRYGIEEDGTGGYYIPPGTYTQAQWDEALQYAKDHTLPSTEMPQYLVEEPEPDGGDRAKSARINIQPYAKRNGTAGWMSDQYPGINTTALNVNGSYMPESVKRALRASTEPEEPPVQEGEDIAQEASSGAKKQSAAKVTKASAAADDELLYGLSNLDTSRRDYLSALDALARGSVNSGGLKNTYAVQAGQDALIYSGADERAYSNYLKRLKDLQGRYKTITSKRSLY